jgi:hypothetical protein
VRVGAVRVGAVSATEARPAGGGIYVRADGGGGESKGGGGGEGNRGKGEGGGHEGGGEERGRAGCVEEMEAAWEFTWEGVARLRVAGEMVAEARVAVERAVELAARERVALGDGRAVGREGSVAV